ncbi:MAG: MFS transporter, partial [Nitrososphaera sp.]
SSDLLAPAVGDMALALLGSFVYFLGFNMVMPIAFTVTAELFPTRARASGFALSEGLGHIGGAISMFAASAILYITSDSLLALLAVTSFQVAAAVLIQLAPRTTARILEEVSP